MSGIWATVVHTVDYPTVTTGVVLLVYQKLGLASLRRVWFNLNLIWAIALIATGFTTLLV